MSKTAYYDQTDDRIPSYEESVGSSHVGGWRGTLDQKLSDTLQLRIQSILEDYVDPLLESQAASGLFKTVFVLIPSNVAALNPETKDPYSPPKEPEVVGFASTDVVKLVRLEGNENTLEFWRQPTAIQRLAETLRIRLRNLGHRVEEPGLSTTDVRSVVAEPPSNQSESPKSKSKSIRKLLFGKSIKERLAPSEAVIIDQKLGWRDPEEERVSNQGRLAPGVVRVGVRWDEVCLRIENALGLYEDHQGPGICLTVEVGS
ncbi:hypothetical protein VTN31DRAFT_136 [Thermomyces dupontii]|uniref:uncharacterized protein n=1 Tax=Talaromyces thermophilus TaxID=28565 RepID=UPI003743508D